MLPYLPTILCGSIYPLFETVRDGEAYRIDHSISSLSGYLAEKTKVDRWFDLESFLRVYASVGHKQEVLPGTVRSDEIFFYQLRDGLNANWEGYN